MAAPVITISSDASEESVTSVVSRVILFGTILTEIPIIPDMPTDLPTVPELPALSPFVYSDDSESESADELPERHVSLRPHDDMISSGIQTTARKSTLGLCVGPLTPADLYPLN
uniref:Uncharacterized protein n=1 Tax=Tanacetum cinerariifolium TaxID=118510 RepID=A0A699H666_TANCI|nr:hypothetical protein [Tanacetum cinerariifolium]